jgi:lysophospholipase L1-like esterase
VPQLPPEYLDPRTPEDVVVTDRSRPRITDPTLGQELGSPERGVPDLPEEPRHALVALGDSLTHGMSNGAVTRPDLSWPALVARSLNAAFAVPRYEGPLGGLPLDVEGLLRTLQKDVGDHLDPLELLRLPFLLQGALDTNEDHWEQTGSWPADVRYENLAIYGWDVRDALSATASRAAARIVGNPPRDELFGALPANHNDMAALSVLTPFGPAATQVGAAEQLGADGGIDTLVVALGANNALKAVVHKGVEWSGPGFADLDAKEAFTVWRPTHFDVEHAHLVRALRRVRARRVVLATVPHVTVAPIAKGVNPDAPGRKWRRGSRYFPYYTDPWVQEQRFRPGKHRGLTHQQARAIDSAIDQYNDTIAAAVRTARAEGRRWLLLDLCGILDGLAHRRFLEDPAAREENGWEPYPLPDVLADLDTRFFLSDADGRQQGGLFGLDGVHPTTCGYGVLAGAVLDVLEKDGVSTAELDLAWLRERDTLNADPPTLMTRLFDLVTPFLTRLVRAV